MSVYPATSENPVSMGVTPDRDLNWNVAPSSTSKGYFEGLVKDLQTSIFGQEVFQGGDDEYLKNGDVVPTGVNYLRINTSKGLRVVKFSPLSSGSVSELSDTSAKIDGNLVKFSLAVEVELLSVSDLLNFKKFLEGDKVKTAKFNTDVEQNWLITSSPSAGSFNLNLGDGLFAEEVSEVKFFESFGAYADGTTPDDEAFKFARSYAGKVYGHGDYIISQLHPLTNNTNWYGKWSKISAQGSNRLFTFSSNVRFGEFELDGLGGAHTSYPTQILSPSENVELGDIIYRNFHGVLATFQTYVLNIPMYGAKNFKIGNLEFYNITQDDDGAVTGRGFVGGVYIVGLNSEISNGKSYGRLGDIYGDTIKSVGLNAVQDSDLVRFFAETASTEEFDITFGNVTGRNVYKRIVKAASCGGITFGNVKSFNPEDGVEDYKLFAAVEVLSTAFNFKFGDVETIGPSERTVWFKNKGNKCGDIYSGGGGVGLLLGDSVTPAISCQAGNIIGRGGKTGGSQGIGVNILNADYCQAGDITGLFNVSFRASSTDNTGNNSVGNISCNGRIEAYYGSTSFGAINVDISKEPVAGSHCVFGKNSRLTTSKIITDGRITVSIVGSNLDVDLGRMRIIRATAINGNPNSHSVFTTTSAQNGILRGNLEIEVNTSVAGTPSGSSGKTLAYFTKVDVDDFNLSMKVTGSIRGATGLNVWFNSVDGQANRVAIKSAMSLVGSKFDGNLCIDKLENLVSGGSTVACTGEVNAPIVEKRSDGNVTGLANTPAITIISTR